MKHAVVVIILLLLCLALTACGGGGSGVSSTNVSDSVHPQTAGPGDVEKFFPLTQGDTWTFRVTTNETGKAAVTDTQTMKMTGTKTVDGYETNIMTFTGSSGGAVEEEYYLKTGAGLYYFGSNTSSFVDKAIIPYQAFRFPLQLDDTFVQLNSSRLDFGEDLDGDGRNEGVSIRTEVKVAGFETVTVDAGTFPDCARIETIITETLYLSKSGTQVIATGSEIYWYAPTAGPIKKHFGYTVQGQSSSTDYTLVSLKVSGYKSDRNQPVVVSTQPASIGILSTSTVIQAVFSEEMDPLSLNNASFILTDSSSHSIAGTVAYNDKTATFTPSSLLTSGAYTATITTLAQDAAENKLSADRSWSFTVDTSAPEVIAISPTRGAIIAATSKPITATFSEPINILGYDSLAVTDSTGLRVAGRVTYNGNTATFTPDYPLLPDSIYSVKLTQIQDLVGNNLASSYSWSFITAPGRFLPYMILPTGSQPEAVAIGDVNGDGKSDVVMVTSYRSDSANDYKLFVSLQNAAGGLDPAIKYSTSGSAQAVAIGDMNHDGRNDVVVGGSNRIQVFLQNSAGGLTLSATYPSLNANKIRVADLNNDGMLDVVGIGPATGTVDIWVQNAAGELNAPVAYTVNHFGVDDVQVGDVNNDGLNDIVIMNGESAVNLATGAYLDGSFSALTQNASGSFNPPASYSTMRAGLRGPAFSGVMIGDVTGDGLSDVVFSGSALTVFPQNGEATLGPYKSLWSNLQAGPVEIADINNDGWNEIVVLHGGRSALGVYRQSADGTLQGEELFAVPYAYDYNPRALAIGDLNADGFKDVVIADPVNGLVILYANKVLATKKIIAKPAERSIASPILRRMKMRRY